MKRSTTRAAALAVLVTVAIGVAGCSSRSEKPGEIGGKTMNDTAALAALKDAETSGKLNGLEIEHYVGGGLPPPHHRSEQFRLYVSDGRDTLAFVTPDFTARVKQGESYPNHAYELPATPADVRQIARLVRESGAFSSASTPQDGVVADGLRTELVLICDGKGGKEEAKRVYSGAEPPELAKLLAEINAIVARIKAQGVHKVRH
jgi:hypothetical protein